MRATQINTGNYKDTLAQKKRRSFLIKTGIVLGILVFLILVFVYVALFVNAYQIQDVNADNIPSFYQEQAKASIFGVIDQKKWKYFQPQKSIFFFDEEENTKALEESLEGLKNLAIFKEYPNKVIIRGTERVPKGIWCLKNDCRYFDEEGRFWGRAARSSGFLIITVEDLRDGQSDIDQDFFKGIHEVYGSISKTGLAIKDIAIPEDSVNEFQAVTSRGYKVYFSLDSNLGNQVEVFKVFLEQKGSDFQPQYVDLRIDGRVYYR